MSQFFARDFTQDRWRKAALKNAYSLLGKQRFDHAAAFFLLAGSLWDAIQVIKPFRTLFRKLYWNLCIRAELFRGL